MKHLLATTAAALILGTPAFAQDASMGTSYDVQTTDFYATALIGARIYGTEGEMPTSGAAIILTDGFEDIGEINDMVVGEDGSVRAVIVGVGGFVGIGEKDVALPMDAIQVVRDENGDRFLIVQASVESLGNAPAFEYPEIGVDATDAAAMDAAEADMATDATIVVDETAMVDTTVDAEQDAEADVAAANLVESETSAYSEAATDLAQAEAVSGGDTMVEPLADAESIAETEEILEEIDTGVAIADPAIAETETDMTDTVTVSTDMDMPEGFAMVAVTELTSDELTGAGVMGLGDDRLGDIGDLILDDQGVITSAIIDFGGFLGIGQKRVEVGFDRLQILRSDDGSEIRVTMPATREELEAMPEYEG